MLVAAGAYQAEESYDVSDLSLPSYNTDNSDSLVKKETEKKQAVAKSPRPQRQRTAPKDESPEKKAAREAKEAKAAAKAEEKAAEAQAKKVAEFKRYQADLAKNEAKKAQRTATQQKRIEYRDSQK